MTKAEKKWVRDRMTIIAGQLKRTAGSERRNLALFRSWLGVALHAGYDQGFRDATVRR